MIKSFLWVCLFLLGFAALSEADIMSNLALYWKMDENSGTTLTDSAGSTTGNLGTSTTTPTWLTGASCKFGSCLSFDGSDDTVAFTLATGTTYTIAMWIYSATAGAQAYGCLFTGSGGSFGLSLMQSGANNNKLNFFYTSDHFSTGTVARDVWTHVAVVNNAGSLTFYINGTASGTATSAPSFTASRLGWDFGSQAFGGRMDDVRLYSRALSGSDITELVAFNPSATPLKRRGLVY